MLQLLWEIVWRFQNAKYSYHMTQQFPAARIHPIAAKTNVHMEACTMFTAACNSPKMKTIPVCELMNR